MEMTKSLFFEMMVDLNLTMKLTLYMFLRKRNVPIAKRPTNLLKI